MISGYIQVLDLTLHDISRINFRLRRDLKEWQCVFVSSVCPFGGKLSKALNSSSVSLRYLSGLSEPKILRLVSENLLLFSYSPWCYMKIGLCNIVVLFSFDLETPANT